MQATGTTAVILFLLACVAALAFAASRPFLAGEANPAAVATAPAAPAQAAEALAPLVPETEKPRVGRLDWTGRAFPARGDALVRTVFAPGLDRGYSEPVPGEVAGRTPFLAANHALVAVAVDDFDEDGVLGEGEVVGATVVSRQSGAGFPMSRGFPRWYALQMRDRLPEKVTLLYVSPAERAELDSLEGPRLAARLAELAGELSGLGGPAPADGRGSVRLPRSAAPPPLLPEARVTRTARPTLVLSGRLGPGLASPRVGQEALDRLLRDLKAAAEGAGLAVLGAEELGGRTTPVGGGSFRTLELTVTRAELTGRSSGNRWGDWVEEARFDCRVAAGRPGKPARPPARLSAGGVGRVGEFGAAQLGRQMLAKILAEPSLMPGLADFAAGE